MTEELYTILTKPKHLKTEIAILNAKINAYLVGLLPGGIRYDTPRVQTSPKDQFPEIAAKVDDLETKRSKKTAEYFESIKEVDNLAKILENDTQAAIITMHYIDNKSLFKIGDELGYSKSSIKRIHDNCIDFLEKRHEKNEKND